MPLKPKAKQKDRERRDANQTNYNRSKKKALGYVSLVVNVICKMLDKEIRRGSLQIALYSVHIEGELGDHPECNAKPSEILEAILLFAHRELEDLLQKKYLPLGWKSLRINNDPLYTPVNLSFFL